MESAFGGLPHLLAVLGRSPHPDDVAGAIVKGPGRRFGALASAVLWARPPKLVIVGMYGFEHAEVDGLATVDIDGDYPLTRAYLEGEPVIMRGEDMARDYAGMRRPESRWHRLKERMPEGDHVHAPIVSDGQCVGAYSMNCPDPHVWSPLDIACLDATSHALGMWLTHPDSGLPTSDDDHISEEAALSQRHRQILALIQAGRTNTSIAHTLGISTSTVKQELSRIMVRLDVTDRHSAAQRAVDLGLIEAGDA